MSLFKDLSGSLARFIVAWLVPSVAAVAVFAVLVLPDLRDVTPGGLLDRRPPLQAAVQFSIAVLVLSVLFAYVSLPIYQFLEGYTMPVRLARRLKRRHVRHLYRLRAQFEHELRTDQGWEFTLERLAAYPESPEHVMPTRLGNALLAMEEYGGKRFGLDNQTLWYELLSTTSDGFRRDAEDARAGVDVFISALVHLTLLGTTAAVVAVWSGGAGSMASRCCRSPWCR